MTETRFILPFSPEYDIKADHTALGGCQIEGEKKLKKGCLKKENVCMTTGLSNAMDWDFTQVTYTEQQEQKQNGEQLLLCSRW